MLYKTSPLHFDNPKHVLFFNHAFSESSGEIIHFMNL